MLPPHQYRLYVEARASVSTREGAEKGYDLVCVGCKKIDCAVVPLLTANKKARPVDAIGLDELKRVVGGYCLTRQFLKSTMKLSFDATERYVPCLLCGV